MRSPGIALVLVALIATSACSGGTSPSQSPMPATAAPATVAPATVAPLPPATPTQPPVTPASSPAAPKPSVDVRNSTTSGGVTVTDLSFDGGRPTDAYLVAPESADRGSTAGIVWFHWYEPGAPTSNRTEFVDEATALAGRGVTSLLVDGQFPWRDAPSSTTHDVSAVQAEIEMLTRARDLLAAQTAVDPARIAIVGHDFGAMYSSVVFGEDQSIRALVMMAPTARWADWFLRYWPISDDPAAYKQAFVPFDPVTALTHANGRPVLLQFANADQYVPAATAAEITSAAGGSAQRKDYAAGHQLDSSAQTDRDNWLVQILHLGPSPS